LRKSRVLSMSPSASMNSAASSRPRKPRADQAVEVGADLHRRRLLATQLAVLDVAAVLADELALLVFRAGPPAGRDHLCLAGLLDLLLAVDADVVGWLIEPHPVRLLVLVAALGVAEAADLAPEQRLVEAAPPARHEILALVRARGVAQGDVAVARRRRAACDQAGAVEPIARPLFQELDRRRLARERAVLVDLVQQGVAERAPRQALHATGVQPEDRHRVEPDLVLRVVPRPPSLVPPGRRRRVDGRLQLLAEDFLDGVLIWHQQPERPGS
jgi:hypothetical protein